MANDPVSVVLDTVRPGTPEDPMWRDHEDRPVFRHRPKVVGPEISVTLDARDILWSNGKITSRLPLHQVEEVRIVFRPANLYLHRYRVQVRQRLGGAIWFANVSYRGMVEMEAHDAPFAAFVRTLCLRVKEASPKTRFVAGEPLWRYVPGVVVTAALALSLLYIGFEAIRAGNYTMLGLAMFIGGFTAWQMGQWIVKNRPGTFDPTAIPPQLLPPVTKPQP